MASNEKFFALFCVLLHLKQFELFYWDFLGKICCECSFESDQESYRRQLSLLEQGFKRNCFYFSLKIFNADLDISTN